MFSLLIRLGKVSDSRDVFKHAPVILLYLIGSDKEIDMNKLLLSVLAVLLLLTGVTACGGSNDSAIPDENKQELVEVQEQEAQAKGGFDSDIKLPTGETYRLSSPTKFTPGKFAAGQVPGQSFNRFEVSVTNGGTADLDLAVLIVSGTTSGGACVDIFDGDNNINGAPLEPLAAGATKKFGWALSCPGAAGDELKVKLISGETALIEATGKLS
jgi:predicted small lipoprotein YifL